MSDPGVSFVVPVHDAGAGLHDVVQAILAQDDGRPFEVILVDDASRDGTATLLDALAGPRVRALHRDRRGGPAAAINDGVRRALHPIICQIDQDVVLEPGWLHRVLEPLRDEAVGAVQGYYRAAPEAGLWARLMGLDVEQRYGRIPGDFVDHVVTGNSAYRADALHRAGLFDEALGYGHDVDLSYRLSACGYRLAFRRDARSIHRWRTSLSAYLRQQYGFGYGRLEVVRKHRRRWLGDDVARATMMLHVPAMTAALLALLGAAVAAMFGGPFATLLLASALLGGLLFFERLLAGISAWRRFGDPVALLFPVAHLGRDLAWVAAALVWTGRRLRGQKPEPMHSL